MTIMTIIDLQKTIMSSQSWTVAEAKAKFSEVIDRAQSDGPQTVTRHGRSAVVIVAAEEWRRKTKRVGTLADFFANSPLREGGLKLPRRTRPRRVTL
jgi:prevent-host-death family protein